MFLLGFLFASWKFLVMQMDGEWRSVVSGGEPGRSAIRSGFGGLSWSRRKPRDGLVLRGAGAELTP